METGLCVAEEGPERGSSGPAPDGDGGRGRRGGGEVEKRGGGEEGWRAGAPRPRAPHGHKAVGTLPGASFRVCSLLLPLTQSPVIGQGVSCRRVNSAYLHPEPPPGPAHGPSNLGSLSD
nr:uncharacterized protein LOC123288849 isoform X3 [Equus asinus]